MSLNTYSMKNSYVTLAWLKLAPGDQCSDFHFKRKTHFVWNVVPFQLSESFDGLFRSNNKWHFWWDYFFDIASHCQKVFEAILFDWTQFHYKNTQYKNVLYSEFCRVIDFVLKMYKTPVQALVSPFRLLRSPNFLWRNIQSYEYFIHVFSYKRSSMSHISSLSKENVEQTLYASCLS